MVAEYTELTLVERNETSLTVRVAVPADLS